MEDEEYARRLFAILTNPQPTGIDPDDPYGQADDGIDRYNGFGRDSWVESVAVAEGEHGSELLVEFGLALPPHPDLVGVPQRGTLRLAFDSEWRELSGYEDPAAYAAVVARGVGIAVGRQLERHRRGAADSREGGEGRLAMLDADAHPVRGTAFEREIAEARAEHPVMQVGWHAHPPENPGQRPESDG